MKEKPVWRKMTKDEQRMATALGRCRFSPGSWQKRFARHLYAQAIASEPIISAKQAELLRKVVVSWRRQIPKPIVDLAEGKEIRS